MGSLVEIVAELRLQMLLGQSVTQSLEVVLGARVDSFSSALKIWFKRFQAGQKTEIIAKNLPSLMSSAPRRTFVTVLERGLSGSPIDSYLLELESEFTQKLEMAFDKKMQLLPMKLLVPLTVFVLPAIIILIIGPLFLTLVSQI